MSGPVVARARDRVVCAVVCGAVAAVAAAAFAAPSAGAWLGVTERVSVGSDGGEANAASRGTSGVSADGRFVVFPSAASNLVADDSNGTRDVFVRDRHSGVTERVSVGSSGTQANADSTAGSVAPSAVSADGRFVVFDSTASNLVAGDTNGTWDVFVRDRQSGTTERVSVGAGGAQADGPSSSPVISGDGRFVAFRSWAPNLGIGVFVRDRQSGITEPVVVSNEYIRAEALSRDGRFLAFSSDAAHLVAGDTNNYPDVFVRDRVSGVTERVSVGVGGAQANAQSYGHAISADGRFVAFSSPASNLAAGDTNDTYDVFVRDRLNVSTERVSLGIGGAPGNGYSGHASLSADGRFVAFWSWASNLVDGDINDEADAFVHDRHSGATERVSVGPAGAQANSGASGPAISADGRVVAFGSGSSNLVAGDTNNAFDVFVRDRTASDDTPADTSTPSVHAPWFPFASQFTTATQQGVLTQVRWSASDASGICRLELQQSVDGGPYVGEVMDGSDITDYSKRLHGFDHRYRYRVRATDCAGNTSPWKYSWTFVPTTVDASPDALAAVGTWSQIASIDSFNGTLTSTLTAGESISYTTRARRIAWVAPRDRHLGSATVYVDDVEARTVDLYAARRQPRRVVWQKAWPATGTHTIRIQARSGRIDVDAFGALRLPPTLNRP